MNSDVSKLRGACEVLHAMQVKLVFTERCVNDENDRIAKCLNTLAALKAPHAHSAAEGKELSMLKRLLQEEASALGVLEKSLASQMRFEDCSLASLNELHRRVSDESTVRARVISETRRLEEALSREQRSHRELVSRVADQEKHERGNLDHLVQRESALQKARDEVQFCERALKAEQNNLYRLKSWVTDAHKEHLRLLEINTTREAKAQCSDADQQVGAASSDALSTLKRATLSLMKEVVASAHLLEHNYVE